MEAWKIYLKKSLQNGKAYLSLIKQHKKDDKWVNETIQSLGGFDIETAERIAKPMKLGLHKINSLIEAQRAELEAAAVPPIEPIHYRNGDEIVNAGSLYIVYALIRLGMRDVLDKIQRQHDWHYSFWNLFCFLIVSRIIWPGSMEAEYNRKKAYIHLSEFSLDTLYRFLDLLSLHLDEFEEVLDYPGLCENAECFKASPGLKESAKKSREKISHFFVDKRDVQLLKGCLGPCRCTFRTIEHRLSYRLICLVSVKVLYYLQDLLDGACSPEQIQNSMRLLLASKDRSGRFYHLNGDDQLIRKLWTKTGIGFEKMDYTMEELEHLFELEEVEAQEKPAFSLDDLRKHKASIESDD